VSDEARLLERAGEYDPVILGQIYDEYFGRIYAYIYHRIGDARVAEDLTADVFLRMLESVKAEKGWQTSLTGWLYRIAHNLVIDHYRRQSKRDGPSLDERLVAAAESTSLRMETLLSQEQLRTAIQTLTEEQQQVVVLKFVEDLSNAEVARILGKTEGAVKALQHRALVTLRRALGDVL
jgi:RNA polymerase sigma-70 factor (ECF subfamily)